MTKPLLRVEALVKRFPVKGGLFSRDVEWVHAVDGVSFELEAGETLGVGRAPDQPTLAELEDAVDDCRADNQQPEVHQL